MDLIIKMIELNKIYVLKLLQLKKAKLKRKLYFLENESSVTRGRKNSKEYESKSLRAEILQINLILVEVKEQWIKK